MRCLFIEKDPAAFEALRRSVAEISDLEIDLLHGEFEALIPDILRFIGRSFSLVFIDPTGWTGFGLRRIAPILMHRPGEVLVNFMFDHINRFLDHPSAEVAQSFDELFGGPGWGAAVEASERREDAIVELYRERMRAAGAFQHVTSKRILKPIVDRSYFYLVYGTRHIRGLQEFRRVEKKAVEEQERIRLDAKQADRVERSGQGELFGAAALAGPSAFAQQRLLQRREATSRLRILLRTRQRVRFRDALGMLLEVPLVWESDVQELIRDLRTAGEIEVHGLSPRERTLKLGRGHMLVARVPSHS